MGIARSKITAQGQVSIPTAVMRRFGLAPGETIEWDEQGGNLVVHKTGRFTLEDVQNALRIQPGVHKTDEEIREGVKARARAKHARP